MRILRVIEAQSPRAKEGVFRRLALATALKLAAPELCGYKDIDPLKRYAFYEKFYLDKELDSHFDKHSVWLLRQVVNDPQSEEDMLWMRAVISAGGWQRCAGGLEAPSKETGVPLNLSTRSFQYDAGILA